MKHCITIYLCSELSLYLDYRVFIDPSGYFFHILFQPDAKK